MSQGRSAAEPVVHDEHAQRVPGEDADRPEQIPPRGWLQVAKRVKDEAKADNASLLAGGVAFFALLSVVPLLVAVLAIWGIFASPADATRLIRDLASGLPNSAQHLVTEQVRSIASRSNGGLGLTAALSLVLALWSASSGTKHLIEAVNTAYDEQEDRGFVNVRALALALTGGAIAFLLVAIGLIAVVPSALDDAGVPDALRVTVEIAIWPVLGLLMILSLAVLYRVAPDRADPKWRWVSWGAVVATLLWLVGSAAFALYASNLGSYDKTYGSLGGVIVLMLWLYITALVVVLGAELNAALETQTVRDSTTGPEQPLGQRGAEAADSVPPAQ
jgi:membrane protein